MKKRLGNIKPQKLFENKGSLLFRLIGLLISACVLTAIISAVLYYFIGIRVYGQRIADEMLPRANSIARISERYLRGRVDYDSYRSFVLDDRERGSLVYVFDDQGNLFAYSVGSLWTDREPPAIFFEYANRILTTGQTISQSNTRIRSLFQNGIVVGVPIKDNLERVCGAVLITKPAVELHAAMRSMIVALVLSSLIASVLLSIFAVFAGGRVARPIRNMTSIAAAMASGDFSARAAEAIGGEIGQLGSALNFLSAELSKSIGELMLVQNRLSTILAGLNEGVIALHADLSITFSNPAASRLLGTHVGQNHLDFSKDPVFAEEFKQRCNSVLETGEPAEIKHAFSARILQFVFTRTLPTHGEQYGVIIMIRDITEAERLEKTRRDYVANVSHELRTPIASIRSLAETLNDGMVRDEQNKNRYYGYILRESMRLSRLIDDLLELSRLQSGAVALTKHDFQLSDILSEVAERTRLNAEYSEIIFEYEEQPLPMVNSNPDRIEQVLIALTDNAIKFTVDGGRIHLGARVHEDHVFVEIRNTGHIEEADLMHLFDRFYKADKAHSGQGTGLGLAIAKELLILLGETISARNDGTSVVFSFTVSLAK